MMCVCVCVLSARKYQIFSSIHTEREGWLGETLNLKEKEEE